MRHCFLGGEIPEGGICSLCGAVDLSGCTKAVTLHALALKLVEQQSEDDGLWFDARTAPEAYLQQELRRLHKIIEGEL